MNLVPLNVKVKCSHSVVFMSLLVNSAVKCSHSVVWPVGFHEKSVHTLWVCSVVRADCDEASGCGFTQCCRAQAHKREREIGEREREGERGRER